MFFEGLAVFLSCLHLRVERSKVAFFVWQVVVELLAYGEREECVANVIHVMFVGGDAKINTIGGRTTLWRSIQFDSTKGFPGEDVRNFPES